MNKTKIILLMAEILAVAAIRVIYMVRRDHVLPRGGAVSKIKGKPVYRMPFGKRPEIPKEPEPPEFEIAGWKPKPRHDKLDDTPGHLPGEKP